MGSILKINLANKSHELIPLDIKIQTKYLGGRGLGAHLYSQSPLPATDPNNSVFIVPGALTGSRFPSSSRSEVVSSSPLTSYCMASSFGGNFGAYLKHNNIDALEIMGVSSDWCLITIDSKNIKFEDATKLTGKSILETQAELKKAYQNKQTSIAAIGLAGENLVKFATLIVDKRAAGRTGTGWHFGYKKLKAILVTDTKPKQDPKNPDKTLELTRELIKRKITRDQNTSTYCTPSFTEWSNEVQTYPASNYQRNFVSKEEIAGIGLEEYQKRTIKHEACWSCPLACTRIVKNYNGEGVRGPEYESVWSLGANCDNFDLDILNECNFLCDFYGMDTISTGAVLAWYKECVDKKLIKDTWSSNKMIELIHEIANKKGVGKKLADGAVAAAKKFGVGKEFIAHAKSLELPAWDPRAAIGMALCYSTGPTGGDHCKGWTIENDLANPSTQFTTKGKAKIAIQKQNNSALVDSLGTCMFAEFLYDKKVWSEIFNAYLGLNISENELNKIGKNIFELEHQINTKLGHSIKENILPERIIGYEIEVSGKKVALTQEMFDEMMHDYIKLRNWS